MGTFTAIASQRTTDQVVEQIRQAIAEGQFAHEARLPAERELASQFGVSRGVIREAIKILNGMGLVESRQGSGLYVQNDPVPVLTRALTLSLAREPRMVQQLFEIRGALEGLGASLAAHNHSDDDIVAMRSHVDSMHDIDPYLTRASNDDSAFHLAVAHAADNPYLVLLLQTVGDLIRSAFPMEEKLRVGMAYARQTHAAIVDAIEAGDADRARDLMLAHIRRSAETASRNMAGVASPAEHD